MRKKKAALLAIGVLSVSFWLHDSARCQTSLAPPLSLARPAPSPDKGSVPAANAHGILPSTATDDIPPSTGTTKRSTPAVSAKSARSPKPTADYDGFTVGIDDERVPALPAKPRTTNQSKLKERSSGSTAGQQSFDQEEEEKLKDKLTICRDCK
jgi:hypothetical protein